MFYYLQGLSNKLYNRYLTLERNIKSGSNSFYDSFLDLAEELVKFILSNEEIEYNSRNSLGQLLDSEETKNFFSSKVQLEHEIYKKLRNYVQKTNKHKHHNEKDITIDAVINYLKTIFIVANKYMDYLKSPITEVFNSDYFASIFNEFRKENDFLLEQKELLMSEISDLEERNQLSSYDIQSYQNIVSQKEIEKMEIEDQNKLVQKQLNDLKDIKIRYYEDNVLQRLDIIGTLIAGPLYQNKVNNNENK
jgi:hypothetical protein